MAQRATVVNTIHAHHVLAGDPIHDTDEGVLIVQFDDGTARIFNWAHVVDFYHLTEEETVQARAEAEES